MFRFGTIGFLLIIGISCSKKDKDWEPPETLSEFHLFEGNGSGQVAAKGVIPYTIATPLFSDYAEKYRFIQLPEGEVAQYHEVETFDIPLGTVIAKTFAYPNDMRDLSKGRSLLETRILLLRPEGWIGLPYVWNEEQTEAFLEIAGDTIETEWIHADGSIRQNSYFVPNMNQCKQCHDQNDVMKPIGIRARHLNLEYEYANGSENQLDYWRRHGMLEGVPEISDAPTFPVWEDTESGTLDLRARAWLEINCAHCHSEAGRAWSTGLDLMASQTNPTFYGVLKLPTAAARGTGGHQYDIVPGKPEESIFVHRIASLEPDVAMPELGRGLVHQEGLELITKWIEAMD